MKLHRPLHRRPPQALKSYENSCYFKHCLLISWCSRNFRGSLGIKHFSNRMHSTERSLPECSSIRAMLFIFFECLELDQFSCCTAPPLPALLVWGVARDWGLGFRDWEQPPPPPPVPLRCQFYQVETPPPTPILFTILALTQHLRYRGTSLIRKRPTPRTGIGP